MPTLSSTYRLQTIYALSKATKMFNQSQPLFIMLPLLSFFVGLGLHYMIKKKTKRQIKHVIDINCSICYIEDRSILFYPCKHIAVCEGCASQVHSCPMCRTPIEDKIFIENYIRFGKD